MDRLPDTAEPPLYHLVAGAWQVARNGTRRAGQPLNVAILATGGQVLARGELRGYTQLGLFADMLRKLGYQEVLPRTAQRICECDAAFLAPALDGLGRLQPPLPQAVLDLDAWLCAGD